MKTVLITGGSRGIGHGIAKEFAKSNYNIVVFDIRSEEDAAENMKLLETGENTVKYIRGDLSKAEDRARAIEEAGDIDVLVNNAGVAPRVRMDMLEMTEESYDFVMDINARGTFFLTQGVANKMIKRGKGGTIINISSISADTSSTQRAEYCISKAAISIMTTLFADRLSNDGINVYEIRPGIIATDMTSTVKEKYDKLIFEEGILPIKRWGMPEDIAKAAVALSSGAFSYTTGQVIFVDGGFHIRRL